MATIHNLTGPLRANGTAIFCFDGPADRAVVWSIASGSGSIVPIAALYTDQYGRAAARYDAGGYVGDVVIQVAYVP